MKKNIISAMLILASAGALAQSSDDASTSAKASDLAPAPTKANDIDNEITNAKLRALSGSKSKLSIKADLSYNGGSLLTPLSDTRPNYAATANTVSKTSFGGNIAAAYRLADHDALRLGTGITIVTPLQDTTTDALNSGGARRKSDISNPFLDYSHTAKIGNTQNITDMSVTMFTQSAYVDGYLMTYSPDINQTIVYEMGHWSPGINVDANYTFYKDGAQSTDISSNNADGRVDLQLAIYPYIEYSLSEKASLRTVFRFLTFDHYRSDDASTYLREVYTQSVGVGYAVTRDIYLYPNLQFAPATLAQDKSNVGISATINL
jgi:hypothetical protein